jgi:hypothetical protein
LASFFGPLRAGLKKLEAAVEVSSGIRALDEAVFGARSGSAWQVFAVSWSSLRGGVRRPKPDPLAVAIMAGDVAKLGGLIGGRAAEAIRISPELLPRALPRRTVKPAKLLDVAAAVGGPPLRYLLEFFHLGPGVSALHQAVAAGAPEGIRTIWDRILPAKRERHLSRLAMTAADFHQVEVLKWLLSEDPGILGVVRRFARELALFDVLLRLPDAPEALPEWTGLLALHGQALGKVGVRLAAARFMIGSKCEFSGPAFAKKMAGAAPTLLLVSGADGSCFGAFVAVEWAGTQGLSCDFSWSSFLFTIDGQKATRYRTVRDVHVFHTGDWEFLSVGELRLRAMGVGGAREYAVTTGFECAEKFPPIAGKVTEWELWAL